MTRTPRAKGPLPEQPLQTQWSPVQTMSPQAISGVGEERDGLVTDNQERESPLCQVQVGPEAVAAPRYE